MFFWMLGADGEPVRVDDVNAWGRWFETADRLVAQEAIGAARISTVFLALDHAFGGGPPVLWETMVFGGPLDGTTTRYTSRAAALKGHQAMCWRAREAAKSRAREG